ncbi:hypothetical protein KIH74_10690 [Kineosporia sp. J2-2]|uniref:Uncharacterized protein n=1 Tax=Kineosporia corallincola TaxID=2835133 RepID=A0ABS5TEX7_9ACTN|nr:hypothetical protein [Kineosporia corallincola]MBT0769388.1 hypothetical protein [Kineosporia corallincola]
MDELSRMASTLEACAHKLEVFSARLRADELFSDLRQHPDLAYLDTQLDGFYGSEQH